MGEDQLRGYATNTSSVSGADSKAVAQGCELSLEAWSFLAQERELPLANPRRARYTFDTKCQK